MSTAKTPQQYIDSFSGETHERLVKIREIVRTAAPDAEEGIMYGLVGYKMRGKPLLYFGAYSSHIGLYATPAGHAAFADDFAVYKQGKGSVQFPLDQPLPVGLIKRVVQFRVGEVAADNI